MVLNELRVWVGGIEKISQNKGKIS
jgi:hypothetical protein